MVNVLPGEEDDLTQSNAMGASSLIQAKVSMTLEEYSPDPASPHGMCE